MTVLGKVHTHLFLLGMVMFMLIALFTQHSNLQEMKTFRVFLWLYNIGVPLTVIMIEALLPVWRFFDLKSYCIMAVMMGGGIWLRTSGLVSDSFIAIFYTGLGCALTLAGVLFWIKFGGKAS